MKPISLALLVTLALPCSGAAGGAPPGMKRIDGGSYRPLVVKDAPVRQVAAFHLDETAVTNGQFLEFVRKHPGWRRSKVPRVLADVQYLAHWAGDLELGPRAPLDAPVTGVSWFAARAYLASVGKRLPSTDEWEFAARADETSADATGRPDFAARLLAWYARPAAATLPVVTSLTPDVHGIRGLHGATWEWVRDFNNALDTGEGRTGGAIERDLFCAGGSASQVNRTDYAAFMRHALRTSLRASFSTSSLGFRGAWSEDTATVAGEGSAASLPPGSIWQLGGVWRNQRGEPVPLPALGGKWQVLCMGYTSCAYACPRITAIMQAIERSLSPAAAARTQFTFASFDSVRDTPEHLLAHARTARLERWNFLTADAESVLELAAVLGVKYEPYEGDFAHSNVVFVLNPAGEIVVRLEGLSASPDPAVRVLENSASPPSAQ